MGKIIASTVPQSAYIVPQSETSGQASTISLNVVPMTDIGINTTGDLNSVGNLSDPDSNSSQPSKAKKVKIKH